MSLQLWCVRAGCG